MAETENNWVKAEKVVNLDIALLRRQLVVGATVRRDAGADFTGAKNDTITVRVPSKAVARRRALRSSTAITTDTLNEFGVAVQLTHQVYSSIAISDEEFTLDITDFGAQVSRPQTQAVAEDIENMLVEAMQDADYETIIDLDLSDIGDGITSARKALNDNSVPLAGRTLLVGSAIEKAFLDSDRFTRVDATGSANALENAIIDRRFGFTIIPSAALDENEAYAYTRDAFVLVTRAPKVPDGAAWGASLAQDGFGLRHIRDYDYTNVRDRSLVDTFAGVAVVEDPDDYTDPESTTSLIRAVKLSVSGS